MAYAKQFVSGDRDEQRGETVYFDFSLDARICRIGEVDYKQGVYGLVCYNVSFAAYETHCLDAFVSGKARDRTCFL